jgi:hypothetical protein
LSISGEYAGLSKLDQSAPSGHIFLEYNMISPETALKLTALQTMILSLHCQGLNLPPVHRLIFLEYNMNLPETALKLITLQNMILSLPCQGLDLPPVFN